MVTALSPVSAPLILTERSGRLTTALRYVVTVVCAASAGIHAALVKPHVEEGGPLVGAATGREELDPLGVFTTGAELIGALGAAVLIRMKETA